MIFKSHRGSGATFYLKFWRMQYAYDGQEVLMFFNSLLANSLWADVTNYFANFSSAKNSAMTAMLWIAIVLIVAFIVCKIAIKKDYRSTVNRSALFIALLYSAVSIVTFAVFKFIEDDIVAITFYPLLVFVILCIAGAFAVALKPLKAVKITAAALIAAALISALICFIVYYSSGEAADWNGIEESDVNSAGLYIASAVLVIAIAAIAIFSDRNAKDFDSRSLSFAAVCVAISFALSYIRFFKMPMGGSITFASMLPIMLYSYMFGARKGVVAGLVYGVLQAVQDPWLLHPAQFLLDYGVAFAAVGVTGCIKGFGLFKGKPRIQFTLGGVIGGALRFVSHFFSGAFAFGMYGAQYAEAYNISALSNRYIYSLIYQCLYVIPEIIIVIVVGVILLSSKNFVKQVEKYSLESHYVTKKPAATDGAAN